MSVGSAPPASAVNPSGSAAAGGAVASAGAAIVVQVLAAYGGDSVRNGLVQTLQNSAGPGNLLSGTITDVRPDGTFTLQTKAGPELTLQRPPDVPLTVGSAITLRLVQTTPQPQVAILTLDGKLISSPTAGAGTPAPVAQPASGPTPLINPLPPAVPGLPPATLAATLFASISLEDEVAIETALSGGGTIATQAADDTVQASADSVIATLIRAAPARTGGTPVPQGTRYLATVSVGTTDTDPTNPPVARSLSPAAPPPEDAPSDDTPEPAEPETPAPAEAETPQPAPAPTDLSSFKALTTVLAGRVLATSTRSETLVDTAVGTLSIPVQDVPPPVGSAIQLKIVAVAPPVTTEKPVSIKAPVEETATAQPVLLETAAALAQAAPTLAQQVQTQLSLPPNDQLTSMILSFLGGLKAGPQPARWPDPPVRKALVEAGRSDIATKLDTDASQIGQHQPAPPGDWSVTVLPYLGLATTKPMKLYRRSPDEEEQEKGGGERFVIELEMVRLGAMQFDGLVRERRFDLVLRSEKPVEDALKTGIEQVFRDALLIAGWSGELSYAKTGPVPMIPLKPDNSGVGLSA